MGQKVMIMIVALLVITGTIMMVLHNKQMRTTERLAENTYTLQAKHLANSFVKVGLRELMEVLGDNDREVDMEVTRHNLLDIQNSVTSFIIGYGIFDHPDYTDYPIHVPPGDHLIATRSIITTPQGIEYVARTHLLYRHGSSSQILLPPYIPGVPVDPEWNLTPGDAAALHLTFPTGCYMIQGTSTGISFYTQNNSNGNNAGGANHQPVAANFLELINYYLYLPNANILPDGNGRKYIRMHGTFNYPLTIVVYGDLWIDSSIMTNDDVNIYVDGRVYISGTGASFDGNAALALQANIYVAGNDYNNVSGADIVNNGWASNQWRFDGGAKNINSRGSTPNLTNLSNGDAIFGSRPGYHTGGIFYQNPLDYPPPIDPGNCSGCWSEIDYSQSPPRAIHNDLLCKCTDPCGDNIVEPACKPPTWTRPCTCTDPVTTCGGARDCDADGICECTGGCLDCPGSSCGITGDCQCPIGTDNCKCEGVVIGTDEARQLRSWRELPIQKK